MTPYNALVYKKAQYHHAQYTLLVVKAFVGVATLLISWNMKKFKDAPSDKVRYNILTAIV